MLGVLFVCMRHRLCADHMFADFGWGERTVHAYPYGHVCCHFWGSVCLPYYLASPTGPNEDASAVSPSDIPVGRDTLGSQVLLSCNHWPANLPGESEAPEQNNLEN
jgi:hypothetical protein